MRKAFLTVVCAMILSAPALFAQEQKTSQPATVTSVLERALSQMEREFVPAAEAMPDNKFNFAPSTGEFKGVRTFGEQVKHVAASNYLIAAAILDEKPPAAAAEGENGPAAMKSKSEIVQYLKDSLTYAHKAFAAVNENNLVAPITSPFSKNKVTRLGMSTLLVAHSFDHYGQMVEYLRMNGIIPPASRQQ